MASTATPSPFFREWNLRDCRGHQSTRSPAPHQTSALEKLNLWYDSLSGKDNGGILVLPTGGGKTFTAAHFLACGPLSDGYKVLWLAHTHHLLEQAFHCFDPGILGHVREPRSKVGLRVVSGTPGHFPPRDIRPSDDIVIATLQTITNAHRAGLEPLTAYIRSAKGKLFVVFDEAHHSPAPSYRNLLLELREAGAAIFGLTATPTYTDESKRGWLKRLFPQGILSEARTRDLIAQDILARPTFESIETHFAPSFQDSDYQKWLGTYQDLPEDIIESLALSADRNALIAKTYGDNRKKYGKTIIFTDRWFQCEAIVEALRKQGVKADAVYSHVDASAGSVEARNRRDRDENGKVLDRFRRNELEVLVNVRMLTEGTDIPDAQTVFITRQTTSRILLTQMIGRALRGPKFGGTRDAFIVSFVDRWKQAIHFAEYDPLVEGRADEDTRKPVKRPPLQLVSIELIRQLTRMMDSPTQGSLRSFVSCMPVGWYRVTFDACPEGSDEIEPSAQILMVFDDEREGFSKLIQALHKSVPRDFEDELVTLEGQLETVEAWRVRYLPSSIRSLHDLRLDIFHLARHIGQGHGSPEFFPFEMREDHDLESVAKRFIREDLGPVAILEQLRAEFERPDRFWKALFPRFEHMHTAYDACQRKLLLPSSAPDQIIAPRSDETPSVVEPDEAVKVQVKRRDHHRCLCCGAERGLQVDHIIPVYRGGTNDLANLQTLCRVCNNKKRARTMRFTCCETPLEAPFQSLEAFDPPHSKEATDRDKWERFLRQTINFAFQCRAVSKVTIGGRGHYYYHWHVELMRGNPVAWLEPHLAGLFSRIQETRTQGGAPVLQSLTISAPGDEGLRVVSVEAPE